MDHLVVTTPAGIKIEGKQSLVLHTLELLGLKLSSKGVSIEQGQDNLYGSNSKGFISLSDMNDNHLRNAFIKEIRENTDWMSDLGIEELYEQLSDPPEEKLFDNFGQAGKLFKEIQKRYNDAN